VPPRATSRPRNKSKVGSAGKAAAMTSAIDHCSAIHHTGAEPRRRRHPKRPDRRGDALRERRGTGQGADGGRYRHADESQQHRRYSERREPLEQAEPDRKCARRRDERREWLADDQAANQNDHDRRHAARRCHGTEFFPLQLYDVTGRCDYFAALRVFLRVVDRHRLTSWRGGPRSEAPGPHPRGAHSRTIPPPPPKFHPSKNTASFTAASGQLSRPSRGRA
jgi:hypothetical protein